MSDLDRSEHRHKKRLMKVPSWSPSEQDLEIAGRGKHRKEVKDGVRRLLARYKPDEREKALQEVSLLIDHATVFFREYASGIGLEFLGLFEVKPLSISRTRIVKITVLALPPGKGLGVLLTNRFTLDGQLQDKKTQVKLATNARIRKQ